MKKPIAVTLARGAVSGLAGTVVMTAFQKYVEMPLTGRRESSEPGHRHRVGRLSVRLPRSRSPGRQQGPRADLAIGSSHDPDQGRHEWAVP